MKKISIITVAYNSERTISDTMQSLNAQNYDHIEHIIIDGASTDTTLEIIEKYRSADSIVISEPDDGIYDAMNKGVMMASGDIIGILNSDDVFAHPDVLSHIADALEPEEVDACYADIVFVKDNLRDVVRYYRSNNFSKERLAYGWMPAHPSLYVKSKLYENFGLYKSDYKIAADYEWIARLFNKHRIIAKYVPEVWVKMRMGGVSTSGIRSNLLLSREIVRACRENGIKTNLFKVCLKYPQKLLELIGKPS